MACECGKLLLYQPQKSSNPDILADKTRSSKKKSYFAVIIMIVLLAAGFVFINARNEMASTDLEIARMEEELEFMEATLKATKPPSPEDLAKWAEAELTKQAEEAAALEVISYEILTENGLYYVVGEVRNFAKTEYKDITVSIYLYEGEEQVSTTSDIIDSIGPGDTEMFRAPVLGIPAEWLEKEDTSVQVAVSGVICCY